MLVPVSRGDLTGARQRVLVSPPSPWDIMGRGGEWEPSLPPLGDKGHFPSSHPGDREHLPVPGGTGDPCPCPSLGTDPPAPLYLLQRAAPPGPRAEPAACVPIGAARLVIALHLTRASWGQGTVRACVPFPGQDRGWPSPRGREGSSPLGRDMDVQVERSRSQAVPCGQQCRPSLQHTACPGRARRRRLPHPARPGGPTDRGGCRCGVPGMGCMGWGAQCGVPSIRCMGWGAQYRVLRTGCLAGGAQYRLRVWGGSGAGCLAWGTWDGVLSAGCPAWGARDRVTGLG